MPAHTAAKPLVFRLWPLSLWAALIAEASDDRDDVLRFIEESRDTFKRAMAVGEFVGRRTGTMS